jgi:hypothetical protein
MGSMSYHKGISCRKGGVSPSTAKARKEFAIQARRQRPEPEDWHSVRFSAEIHVTLGHQGRIQIIRQPGERYCGDCIHHKIDSTDTEDEEERYKIHVWAAIGHNFKSELNFHENTANRNGKMTQKNYISQILELVVKPLVEALHRFVLADDDNAGHGSSVAIAFELGRRTTALKTISITTPLLLYHLLRTTTSHRNSTLKSFPIGTSTILNS